MANEYGADMAAVEAPDNSEPEEKQGGDYTGPKGNLDLPTDLVTAVTSICRKMDQRELQARLNQVARCQKARLFWRGLQYLKRDSDASSANGTIYAPIDYDKETDEDKMDVFNIYLGYGKSFVATFAQAPVGVRFEGNDPFISSDVEAAREAESAKRVICKVNAQKLIQKKAATKLWTDGMAVFYSYQSTKGGKLGIDKDGKTRPYPCIEVGGSLEWKFPIAQGDMEDWDYARRQREISLSKAKADYPDKADKLTTAGSSSKDSDYSRQARISVQEGMGLQNQTGDAQATTVTESCYWLRPSAFNEIDDKTIKGELKDWFPTGAYICFDGETYVASRDESMDDHIGVVQALEDEGYNSPGMGHTSIGPQESFNDGMNLAQITFKRGVPHSFFDEKLIPPEARKNQKSRPGEAHPVERQSGDPLSEHFYQESPAEAPATLVTYLDNLQGPLTQFLTGQQPALFGGEMGEAGKTSSGYQQALAQAMGLMGLVWVPFKETWSTVMRQCVLIFGKAYPDGSRISTTLSENNGDQTTVTVNVDNLRGNFLCYPKTDENFPESWTAKKAAYATLVAMADSNPVVAQILSHPDNQRLAKDLVGIPDLTIPGADSCEKQMKEIEEMEKQPPVPDPQAIQQVRQAEMAGQQVPPEMLQQMPMISSIDIDPDFDDHQSEFQTCVRWINSPAGQKAKQQNPQWFQNVRLHAMAHKKQLQQPGDDKKPPSETINFKDLPPDGQVQMAGQAGIKLDENKLALQAAANQALKNKGAQTPAAQ